MSTYNNTTLPNSIDVAANARASSLPFVDEFMGRDPTQQDINYPIQKKWLNTSTGAFWELQNFTTISGITTATWVLIGRSATVTETLTGNDGIIVPPTNNNINVLGDVTNILTTGDAATSTLTIHLNGNVATTYVEDVGSAIPSGGVLNVLGSDGIMTTGSGNTITIGLSSGGEVLKSIGVDADTAPGTNPVIPDNTGKITFTGNQIPANSTAKVIRTDSVAANTVTIEVQRSEAVASSTVDVNGVSHFNSANFTVDSNGFVSLISTTFAINIQTFTSSGTYTPTSGMKFCNVVCVGGGGGGGGVGAPASGQNTLGSGGGGGGTSIKLISAATIGASQVVTIGSGGAGGPNTGGNGSNGGTTSLGTIMTATGGTGGAFLPSAVNNAIAGGSSGFGSSGDVNIDGTAGGCSIGVGTIAITGFGGGTYFGGSNQGIAVAGSHAGSGLAGAIWGGGGSGAAACDGFGSGAAGGDGSDGIIYITEYI